MSKIQKRSCLYSEKSINEKDKITSASCKIMWYVIQYAATPSITPFISTTWKPRIISTLNQLEKHAIQNLRTIIQYSSKVAIWADNANRESKMKHGYTQSNNVQPLPIWPTPNYPLPAPGNSKQLVNKLFPKWTTKKDPNHPTKSNVTQHTIYQHPWNSNRLCNIETRNNSRKLPGTMEKRQLEQNPWCTITRLDELQRHEATILAVLVGKDLRYRPPIA